MADSDYFLETLNEATEIATKTKLNIDYVPGTVTIIKGNELKSMGVTNLNQLNAYDMVVGMESVVSSLRGVGSMYGAIGNKIKWMLNGRVIETELRETDDWGKGPVFTPIPVDFIERVEFIRGAGSALYGGNAIFGVINIITKKNVSGVFGEFEYLRGSNIAKHTGVYTNIKEGDLSIDLSLSTYKSDGYDLYVGLDGHFYNDTTAKQTPAYGPGDLPAHSKAYNLMTDFNYKDYKFWVYNFQTKTGQGYVDWYPTDVLPPDDGRYIKTMENTMIGLEKSFLFNDIKITPEIGLSIYENPADRYFKYPANFIILALTQESYTDEKFRSREYKEQKSYGQIDLEYQAKNHMLMGGVFFQNTKIIKDKTFRNYTINSPESIEWFEHTGLLKDKKHRNQQAIYIQDIWDITDDIAITTGIRYDYFSDVDEAFSPRIAGVYSINNSNILKMQYSRSFRPPSFFEAYGYMSPYVLKPETVDTYEIGYIFKYDESTFKATLFKSYMNDMIIQHYRSYYFENLKDKAKVDGLELEYEWKSKYFKVNLNGAFYDTHNEETNSDFSLSSKFIGNIYGTYLFNSNNHLTLWCHYLSKKPRLENDSNGFIPSQDYLNITYKMKFKEVELNLGVKNLFNKIQDTLYMPLNPKNSDDIPYMGQSIWLNFNYNF